MTQIISCANEGNISPGLASAGDSQEPKAGGSILTRFSVAKGSCCSSQMKENKRKGPITIKSNTEVQLFNQMGKNEVL